MTVRSEPSGMNRTGVQRSPIEQAIQQRGPALSGGDAAAAFRGDSPQILLDKLGERLAFARICTRLYDALITKCEIMLDRDISMSIEDLQQIRADEARHFSRISDAIASLGGDPNAPTPSAELVGVESVGLMQVLNDPRTSIAQSLHAIVTAELSDKAGWETLVALADEYELIDMIDDFTHALNQEREHLALAQTWYEEAIGLTYGDVDLTDDSDDGDDGDGMSGVAHGFAAP